MFLGKYELNKHTYNEKGTVEFSWPYNEEGGLGEFNTHVHIENKWVSEKP